MGDAVRATRKAIEDAAVDPCSLIDPSAHWHLMQWAQHMRSYWVDLDYPRSAAVLRSPASSSFDEMAERADRNDARVVEAVIDSLSPQYQSAIHNVYLAAVYRFRGDPVQVFLQAVDEFWRIARRRGLS